MSIRQIKDINTEDKPEGYMQKDFILKEGVRVQVKITRPDNTSISIDKTLPQDKEAKLVFMVQIRDLGNWDSRPADNIKEVLP